VNPLISVGITRQLNFEDLLQLPSHDHSSPLISQLKSAYFHYSHSICGIPRLLLALCSTVWVQFLLVGFYYLLEGLLRIFSTILLGLFLQSLQNTDQSIDQSFVLALLLSLANLLQNFIHHVSFFYSMKMGNNMKIATIGFIYDCLFEIRGNLLQSSGISTGQLVNLISNDVQRFEEWSVVCPLSSFSLPITDSLLPIHSSVSIFGKLL
jgi:ATP-binding cassette, subfamily C (CFTR/MRP), member 10